MSQDFQQQVQMRATDAHTIFIFVSKKDEVDTLPIIQTFLAGGKRVVVPLSQIKTHTIIASEIRSLDDLTEGAYSIPEPKIVHPVSNDEIDIYFVPGTLFDNVGNRKGRGLGYFDRFLADIKGRKPIIGLCYKHQLVEHIDSQPWDVPVDDVLTL